MGKTYKKLFAEWLENHKEATLEDAYAQGFQEGLHCERRCKSLNVNYEYYVSFASKEDIGGLGLHSDVLLSPEKINKEDGMQYIYNLLISKGFENIVIINCIYLGEKTIEEENKNE
jgi:hypothetical protein